MMNPRIAADYHELGAWLAGFARSHAKREDGRIEVFLDDAGPREGQSFGVRLRLGGRVEPPPEAPPLEFTAAEVAEGRTRFAWCAALAERLRTVARALSDARAVG